MTTDSFLSWLEYEISEAELDIGAAHQEGGVATEREKTRSSVLAEVRSKYLRTRPRPASTEAWLLEHPTKKRRVVDAFQYDASSDSFWFSPEIKAEYTITPLRAEYSVTELAAGLAYLHLYREHKRACEDPRAGHQTWDRLARQVVARTDRLPMRDAILLDNYLRTRSAVYEEAPTSRLDETLNAASERVTADFERAQPPLTASDIAKFADENTTPEAKIKSDMNTQPVAFGVRWSSGRITPFETERSARDAMGDHVASVVRLGVIPLESAPSDNKPRIAERALREKLEAAFTGMRLYSGVTIKRIDVQEMASRVLAALQDAQKEKK